MNKRILVVEVQEDLRAILRDFLTAADYIVIEAVDDAMHSFRHKVQGARAPPWAGDPPRLALLGHASGGHEQTRVHEGD